MKSCTTIARRNEVIKLQSAEVFSFQSCCSALSNLPIFIYEDWLDWTNWRGILIHPVIRSAAHFNEQTLLGRLEHMRCGLLRSIIPESVSASDCHVGGLCKNDWTDRRPVWCGDSESGDPRNAVLDGGPHPPRRRGGGFDAAFAKLLWPLVNMRYCFRFARTRKGQLMLRRPLTGFRRTSTVGASSWIPVPPASFRVEYLTSPTRSSPKPSCVYRTHVSRLFADDGGHEMTHWLVIVH